MAQTNKQRKPRISNLRDSPNLPSKDKEGEVNIYKSTLALHAGYDSNQIESTLEFLDTMLTGKMGTGSAFTLTIVEVAPPSQDTKEE